MPLEIRQLIREIEPCQSVVGSSTDPWRTAQTRHCYRADERRQIYGAEERGHRRRAGGHFSRNHADGIAAIDLSVVPYSLRFASASGRASPLGRVDGFDQDEAECESHEEA